jgi:hypothetical protein
MRAVVALNIHCLNFLLILVKIFFYTLLAKINIVTPIIWVRSTCKADISRNSNILWTCSTSVTSKLIWILNIWYFLRLNIFSHSFHTNFLPFCCKQYWIFQIAIIILLFSWLLLNTLSASKCILICFPFAPVKWIC